MNHDSTLDDAMLMAYVDGELDAAQAAAVEQALQRDATLAARITQHRALRSQLQAGMSAVLAEPIPERLLNTLAAPEKVIDLQARRESLQRWRSREWVAMAASLVAGIVLGISALNFNANGLLTESGAGLIARGSLNRALTAQLGSDPKPDQPIKIGVSYRNQAGAYCRSFASMANSMAGLACRSDDQWRIQVITETTSDKNEFRQAGSSLPAALLTLIDQQISGEPLDAEAEAAAQRAGWK